MSLYGEVQKEVIQATLADDFGVAATFRETTMIYIERPLGAASALRSCSPTTIPIPRRSGCASSPGRSAPASSSGSTSIRGACRCTSTRPLASFTDAMTQYIVHAFDKGLLRLAGHRLRRHDERMQLLRRRRPDQALLPTPRTTAADFRKLTPLVLMGALRQAGTVVCQPMARVRLEVPAARMGDVLACPGPARRRHGDAAADAELSVVTAMLPSARVRTFRSSCPD